MQPTTNKQNLYIRKLNGLGQKIVVDDSLSIAELKHFITSIKSGQFAQLKGKQFSLIFKGNEISNKPQHTLKQLNIPPDSILHLVSISQQQQQKTNVLSLGQEALNIKKTHSVNSNQSAQQICLRLIFNNEEHSFIVSTASSILQLKKKIGQRLKLVFESLVLSHLGREMTDDRQLLEYQLQNGTLISLKFHVQKPEKKKLESRMVNSITVSDQNNEPNPKSNHNHFNNCKVITNSSKSFNSGEEDDLEQLSKKPTTLASFINTTNQNPLKTNNMYRSQITSFGTTQGVSKAALIFKNALHQKIFETESIVSGQFSEDASVSGCDPNSIMVTLKNELETKYFIFECHKTHQIHDIKQKILQIERLQTNQSLEISMEEDLFQSIDLNKSGCTTIGEIVKKMGKERAVFIYRII